MLKMKDIFQVVGNFRGQSFLWQGCMLEGQSFLWQGTCLNFCKKFGTLKLICIQVATEYFQLLTFLKISFMLQDQFLINSFHEKYPIFGFMKVLNRLHFLSCFIYRKRLSKKRKAEAAWKNRRKAERTGRNRT